MRFYKKNQNKKVGGIRKNVQYIIFLLFLSLFVVKPLIAAPLGLPQSTAKIGYSAGLLWLTADDPDGDTESSTGGQPFGLVYSDWFVGDFRYWAELFYYSASLDAATDKIGQDVKRYGLRLSAQKSFRIVEKWAPWLGLGFDVSEAKFTLRHTIDSEGFLDQRLPDRDELAVSLLVNAISEWSIARNWSIAVKLEQSIPVSSDLTEFLVSGALLYRY